MELLLTVSGAWGLRAWWASSSSPDEPLTRHHFSAVKPRAPQNLTVHAISHTWLLTWSNPYPLKNHLWSELTYLVNISKEDDPTDVSGRCMGFPQPCLGLG